VLWFFPILWETCSSTPAMRITLNNNSISPSCQNFKILIQDSHSRSSSTGYWFDRTKGQIGEESWTEAVISWYEIKNDSLHLKKRFKTGLIILIEEMLSFSSLAIFKELSWMFKFTLQTPKSEENSLISGHKFETEQFFINNWV